MVVNKKQLINKRIRSILVGALFVGSLMLATPVDAAGITAGVMNTTKGSTNNHFVLNVAGVKATSGIQKIDCDVWSANNSQDDIKNYVLDPSGSDAYKKEVSIADHHNDNGFYYVTIYATDGGGGREKIGDTYALLEKQLVGWQEWQLTGTTINSIMYQAKLDTTGKMTPNIEANNSDSQLKSGYGFSLDVSSQTTVSDTLPADGTATAPQNINTVFPEFNYKDGIGIGGVKSSYNRLGVIGAYTANANIVSSVMNFKANEFSSNKSQVHFTPIWYPDGTEYKIGVEVFDAWTPGGMLSSNTTPSINIDSQVYDDWHIAPIL